jgi:nickel/cobalt transporter (NicO) family protein
MKRTTRTLLIATVAVAAIALTAGAIDAALAQGSPFGVGTPKSAPAASGTGIVGWIMVKQAEFYKGLSGAIRTAKTDWSGLWLLLGLSFAYGVFHAAGPGHGKAVISSYVVANDETWRRGVVLSFASALLQALVAVVFVGIAAAILNATARTMNSAVNAIEIASYALIALIGARLVWVKGRAFLAAMRAVGRPRAEVGAAVTAGAHRHDDCGHSHGHGGHGHHHSHDRNCHADGDASAWGHAHAPVPQDLAGPGGWTRGLPAIAAVGLRPCSGAILLLVFALAQGMFWAGVAATFVMGLGTAITVAAIATIAVGAKAWAGRFAGSRSGYGMLAMRGVEVAAALVILGFGTLLLTGYLASERIIGV